MDGRHKSQQVPCSSIAAITAMIALFIMRLLLNLHGLDAIETTTQPLPATSSFITMGGGNSTVAASARNAAVGRRPFAALITVVSGKTAAIVIGSGKRTLLLCCPEFALFSPLGLNCDSCKKWRTN